ncbi:uncharacterized protein ISCGN_004110 [Ixodes scapularis]
MNSLAKRVQASKKLSLEVFFTAKTHKGNIPFRVIASERDSWQREVGGFLGKQLAGLDLNDPFLIRNSEAAIQCFSADVFYSGGFSIDVDDLFYSIRHDELFSAVRECIERNDEIAFRNSTGLSVDSFIELLTCYLDSTFVSFESDLYVQKHGICIGSRVAPVLCDIFLARFGRDVLSSLKEIGDVKILRYVDDFVVLVPQPTVLDENLVKRVLGFFSLNLRGLKFTHETMASGKLQFLDLSLDFQEQHVYWEYRPRSKKMVLPINSAHTLNVFTPLRGVKHLSQDEHPLRVQTSTPVPKHPIGV